MTTIGIDPSINSTGVCINYNDEKQTYILIPSHLTRKMKNIEIDNLYIYLYDKTTTTSTDYNTNEVIKTSNVLRIVNNIEHVLKQVRPDKVILEAPSFGSFPRTTALVDLIGLNYLIREACMNLNIEFELVAPNSLKKFAVGNGKASKEMMVDAWTRIDPTHIKLLDLVKVDDLADAYFLSNYKKTQ